jgi:hypothetical protein
VVVVGASVVDGFAMVLVVLASWVAVVVVGWAVVGTVLVEGRTVVVAVLTLVVVGRVVDVVVACVVAVVGGAVVLVVERLVVEELIASARWFTAPVNPPIAVVSAIAAPASPILPPMVMGRDDMCGKSDEAGLAEDCPRLC